VAVAIATPAGGSPPVVAVLPPVLPFELSRHARLAEGLMDLLQTRLDDGRVVLVERQRIEKVLAEQRLVQALAAVGSLAWGRGLGADLLVLPEFLPPPETQTDAALATAGGAARNDAPPPRWTLRLMVVDPEKASIVSTAEVAVPGDSDAGPESLDVERVADALANRLVADAARLAVERAKTPVAVLFFENVTPASDRLDGYGADLVAGAAAAGDAVGLRMLRFAAVGESRAEQDLAVSGFVAAGTRWDEIARWWVWGECEEVDWEARPFAESGIVVRARVWDGANRPLVIEERGVGGGREDLAKRVAARIATAIRSGQPTGVPQPPEKLAAGLFEQALALQAENIGGDMGVNDAWLDRWRRTNRLLELARFIAPDNRAIALEHVLSRYRCDMIGGANAAGTSGARYLDEPEPLWLLGRARAWGEFTARFGLDGEWPVTWPTRPNRADNRVWGFHSVAAQSVNAAAGLLGSLSAARPGSLPLGQGIDPHFHAPWPLDTESLADLWAEWRTEAERRARAVLDGGNADSKITANSLLALVAALPEQLPTRAPSPPHETISWPDEWPVQETAGGLVLSPPTTIGKGTVLASRPLFNLEAGCASNGDWLLAGGWRSGPVVLLSTGADRAAGRVRRIDRPCGLESSVAALARHGSRVWLASTGDGIGHLDLADPARHERFGLADGLPVSSFSDIDIDPDGVPVAASGMSIEPPRIVWRERGEWLARSVPTFTTEPLRPVAHRVACTRKAVVVAGYCFGVSPFCTLLDRQTGRWLDLRERLVAHITAEGLDVRNVLQGVKRFNAIDVVALPSGGFVLLHNLGATWVDDAGDPVRTVPWPRKKGFQGRGRAVLAADATRIWFAAHTGDYQMALYELPLAGDTVPTKPRVPRDPFVPLPLFDDGTRLWLPSHETAGGGFVDVFFLPARTTSTDTPAKNHE
jgi:hypothetical protein